MVIRTDDRVLVDAARAGDLDAFEVLVRRHQAPVYRVALRMVGNITDAEDVAQETFVQAWRSLARFHGDSALATWLYRIATNRSLDLLAKRRPSVELDESRGDPDLDPAAVLARRERTTGVMDALCLPTSARRSCCASSKVCPMNRSAMCSASPCRPSKDEFTALGSR